MYRAVSGCTSIVPKTPRSTDSVSAFRPPIRRYGLRSAPWSALLEARLPTPKNRAIGNSTAARLLTAPGFHVLGRFISRGHDDESMDEYAHADYADGQHNLVDYSVAASSRSAHCHERHKRSGPEGLRAPLEHGIGASASPEGCPDPRTVDPNIVLSEASVRRLRGHLAAPILTCHGSCLVHQRPADPLTGHPGIDSDEGDFGGIVPVRNRWFRHLDDGGGDKAGTHNPDSGKSRQMLWSQHLGNGDRTQGQETESLDTVTVTALSPGVGRVRVIAHE